MSTTTLVDPLPDLRADLARIETEIAGVRQDRAAASTPPAAKDRARLADLMDAAEVVRDRIHLAERRLRQTAAEAAADAEVTRRRRRADAIAALSMEKLEMDRAVIALAEQTAALTARIAEFSAEVSQHGNDGDALFRIVNPTFYALRCRETASVLIGEAWDARLPPPARRTIGRFIERDGWADREQDELAARIVPE